MCGISGLAASAMDEGELRDRAAGMIYSLRHRGPDGHGLECFEMPGGETRVALAHRRLAIIDLSPAAAQPMTNEDQTVWIVFNGEIYNFQELRDDLTARGHRFRSASDTEVIIHLYEELGDDCCTRLNGIFAFAILDLRKQRLLLARDHLGVKPLYYAENAGRFLFGSEIKALLSSGLISASVNWQAIYDYFTYLYVPSPATAFEGIYELPPAHRMVYDLVSKTHTVERYWRPQVRPEVHNAPPQELEAEARDLLQEAVRRQMVSDVPLGVFLSGGIDSNLVAGLMKKAGAEVHSFTVCLPGDEFRYYDERDLARSASQQLGTVHQELEVSSAQPLQLLELIHSFDQPFGNPTYYLMWLISRAARPHITVALCGAGGDELFAGYPRYAAARAARLMRRLPPGLLLAARKALALGREGHSNPFMRRARRFLEGMDPDLARQVMHWTYFMNSAQKSELLSMPGSASCLPSERVLQKVLDGSELPADDPNRLLELDTATFLPDNVLEYSDKMSMAVGLELRVPLLDPQFVEWSLNIPFSHKLKAGQTKVLLRKAFADLLPDTVLQAPKRGFNAPLGHWMASLLDQYFDASEDAAHPMRGQLGEDIGITWKQGLLNPDAIKRLREEFRSGRRDVSYELFSIIVFDAWYRAYIVGGAYQSTDSAGLSARTTCEAR